MTAVTPLGGGIIAAGEGRRLREDGFAMPKPLVPVAGVPLIEATLRNFLAAGVSSLVVIVNDQGRTCAEWVRDRFPHLDVDFIVKTTPSSLASFREVSARISSPRALISTVDSWCHPVAFADFVAAARRRPPEASVLAVTPFVDDDNPLWVDADGDGRVREVGSRQTDVATAGVYLMSREVRAVVAPPSLGRLREFLAWLVAEGFPVYAERIETVVDIDRASDIAHAEALARADARP